MKKVLQWVCIAATACGILLLLPGCPLQIGGTVNRGANPPTVANRSIAPDALVATLRAGESITELKTVTVESMPKRGDVVFSFDCTHSMSTILAKAQERGQDVMNRLNALPGIGIHYGVMSYMDYPHFYENYYGYTADYGYTDLGGIHYGDYPYRLDQPVTDSVADVVAAINGLALGQGGDSPQDYTRIFYESYADPNVGWRPGAMRIIVNFGDDLPHDNNVYEGAFPPSYILSTGGDPGRDELIGGGDDLDLQTVLADMAAHGVILLEAHTTTNSSTLWTYWTGLTHGALFITGAETLVEDVVATIIDRLSTPTVDGLHLMASVGYESWVSSSQTYNAVPAGESRDFTAQITVPAGTPDGVHTFSVSAVDGHGVSYGDESVRITVMSEISVAVDIKPGSYPNAINLGYKGVVPFAILGTADFEVGRVDPSSVHLGGARLAVSGGKIMASEGDVNGDGRTDLVCHVECQDLRLTDVHDGRMEVSGTLRPEYGGLALKGSDTVLIVR
jgi:hypothetical protein